MSEEFDTANFDYEIKQLQNRIKQLDDAILKVEQGGQEYRIGNRMLKRADLMALYRERRQLQHELTLALKYANAEGGIYLATFYRD